MSHPWYWVQCWSDYNGRCNQPTTANKESGMFSAHFQTLPHAELMRRLFRPDQHKRIYDQQQDGGQKFSEGQFIVAIIHPVLIPIYRLKATARWILLTSWNRSFDSPDTFPTNVILIFIAQRVLISRNDNFEPTNQEVYEIYKKRADYETHCDMPQISGTLAEQTDTKIREMKC
jgi:hypothetical protein